MTTLSYDLKSHTAESHRKAEDAGFVTELLDGRLDGQQVAQLLLQSLVIYRALETAIDVNPDPRLTSLADPALLRVPALETDMQAHFGPEWKARLASGELRVTQGALAYAQELSTVGPHSVTYLVAHHYVRYLGDLSGGQIISTLVQRHYGLTPDGLNFYNFDGIGKLKIYKDAYRTRLDRTHFSSEEKSQILHYATAAFETNTKVFVDLMNDHLATVAH
ncbi:biliverdin-producing heme oxygenase [Arthrobacter sp. TMT4-20]